MKKKMNTRADASLITSSSSTILIIVSIVQFLNPFMGSAVGIALPTIGRELHANAVHLGMIEMIYMLAVSILLLPAGRFSDIYGRKKVFITGISIFTMSTLVLAFSQNITAFIIIRFIQGTGSAMIVSTSVAILVSVFQGRERGRAIGISTASVYLGISAGPTLSGFMITHFGWRSIFLIPFFIQAFAVVLTVKKLKGEWADSEGETFDWKGCLVFMASFFFLTYGLLGLEKSLSNAWFALSGFLGLVFFSYLEIKTEFPLLNVRLLGTNRLFTFSNIATMINYASSFGLTFLFSLYLQTVRRLSPKETGLVLIIQPLIQVFFSYTAGRASEKYSPSKIATAGMALCAAGLFIASGIEADSSMSLIYFTLALMGLGFGLFSSPNMVAIMSSIGPGEYGVASSLVAIMRTTGMLTSMTIVTIILSFIMGERVINYESRDIYVYVMKQTLIIFSIMSVAGIFFSLARVKGSVGDA